MPLFEMEVTTRGRVRVFLRAQFPFALGVAFLCAVAALAAPSTLTERAVVAGILLTVGATVAALVVPWERVPPPWMMTLAGLDLLAVALLRAEFLPILPAVSILAVFPVLWLAYGFPWYGIVAGVLGAVFITSFRFLVVGAWPSNALEWANVVTLPAFIVGIAVIVFVAARQLRRSSRRLTQALRTQAASLQEAQDAESVALGILNTVNAGVAFYDAGGRLEVANARAHRFAELGGFRLDARPAAGADVLDADRSSVIAPGAQLIPRALAGETVSDQLEWWGPAEGQVAVLGSSNRVLRADGEMRGTLVVIHDVTELAEAIEVREQFLHTVSHELRTPLTSMAGFLELLDEAVDPADAVLRGYVDIVTRRTDDLARRVDDLFAASDNAKTLHRTETDVAELVDAAVREVAALAEAHGHTIEIVGASSARAHIDVDQILVAVTELLTNAVKFGASSSPVTVSYEVGAEHLHLAVTNDGAGLTVGEQRRAFDRFYRAPLAHSRAIQGFGLGLTNVRSVAAAHGGTVQITSAAGDRTTVTLALPAGPVGVGTPVSAP